MKSPSFIIITAAFLLSGLTLPAQPSIGGFNVYYGHVHNHSNVSDGQQTPDYAYNYAKNTGHLDFFGLSDHSHLIDATEWIATKTAADKYNEPGVFTTFRGFEWTDNYLGHVAVINSSNYISTGPPTNTFSGLCDWLNVNECIAFFCHPGMYNSTGKEFGHFSTTPTDKFVGMDLWNRTNRFDTYYYTNGYYTGDGYLGYFDEALTRGWKIGASGTEDNHWASWGTLTQSKLAVLAPANNRTEIMSALQARRFYTTYDKNLALSFNIGGNEMGSTMTGGSYDVQIRASDANNEVFTRVQLLKNGRVIFTWTPNSANPDIHGSLNCSDKEYYYIRVMQADGDEAISSPIWISGGSCNVVPTFNPMVPYCTGNEPDALPTVSTNGVNGTWNPATISTAVAGTFIFTFTPFAGQCATSVILSIIIKPSPDIVIQPVSAQCSDFGPVALSATPAGGTFSGDGINGNLFYPASAGDGWHSITYTYTSSNGCSNAAGMIIAVYPAPVLSVTDPEPICGSGTADLTAPAITEGSSPGLTFTYWMNSAATVPIADPTAVGEGNYYIKGVAPGPCYDLKPVTVSTHPFATDPDPITIAGGSEPVCQLTDGTTTTTYSSAAVNAAITYSVSAEAGTIGSTSGIMTWADGFYGTATIVASTTGCNGTKSVERTVTIAPSVAIPVFLDGPESNRVPAYEMITYTATSSNSSAISYSLDAVSLAGGNSINPVTGEVTYAKKWYGTSVITAIAEGCNGPKTATHIVITAYIKVDLYIYADSLTKAYGAPLPALTVRYSGLIEDDTSPAKLPEISTSATKSSPVGTYPVTVSGADDPKYTMIYIPATLTITPVNLVIAADDKIKRVDAPLPELTYTARYLVNGDLAPATPPTLSTTATAESPTGTYPITISGAADGNYLISYLQATLSIINRTTPVISWDKPATIEYGTPLSEVQLNASTGVPGSYTYTPGAGTLLKAGSNQSISVIFTPTDRINYNPTDTVVEINVIPKPIDVYADAISKLFGTADPVLTYRCIPSLVTGDAFSGNLIRAEGETVKNYRISQGTLTSGPNYSITFYPGIFTITYGPSRPITVTAFPGQSKVIGTPDPVFSYYTNTSLDTGDQFTGALSREPGEALGSYAITIGSLTAGSKYSITFISSNFTIKPQPIQSVTVTAVAGQNKIFGETDPVLTYTVKPGNSGAVFTGKLARDAGETAAGSPYAINLGTLDAGPDYRITFKPANFTINPKPITITADAKTKFAGEPDPVFTYLVTPGLVNGDQFSGNLIREPGENPGRYSIKQGALSVGNNYLIDYVSSFLTITNKNTFIFDFSSDYDGWSGDFADYPAADSVFYELACRRTTLPPPLDTHKHALMITGNNHSDDLFMFIKRKITGLLPNKTYQLFIDIEFASEAPTHAVGIGGAPGESVYLKAGASIAEPKKIQSDGFYLMNIDKSNQAAPGKDMDTLGHIGVTDTTSVFTLIYRTNADHLFTISTNDEGAVWICIGTDSGFEGTTTLYYSKIRLSFDSATGIDDVAMIDETLLFPNPVLDILTIQKRNSEVRSIELFDMNGHLISTIHNSNRISLKTLRSGIYSVRVTYDNSTSVIRKIVKQ